MGGLCIHIAAWHVFICAWGAWSEYGYDKQLSGHIRLSSVYRRSCTRHFIITLRSSLLLVMPIPSRASWVSSAYVHPRLSGGACVDQLRGARYGGVRSCWSTWGRACPGY